MIYIIAIICIILDYLIAFFIPNYFNNLNLFYPMLTLTFIIYLYKKINNKKYYKIVITSGIIYDLLFSYLFLFNTLVFILFAKIMIKIDKLIRYNIVVSIVMLILFIFLYDLILFGLVYISSYNSVTFNDLIYKFYNSLLLNIIFYVILTIIFNKKILNKRIKLK